MLYLDGGQIVVTFVSRVETIGLSVRGQPDASLPFRVCALFIDAATGKVNTRGEWPTASAESCVLRSTGGRFVVFTPDKLFLYSPSLQLLKELDLPLRSEATWETWSLFSSPRGRYLLVKYDAEANARLPWKRPQLRFPPGGHGCIEDLSIADAEEGEDLYDTEQLSALGKWTRKLAGCTSLPDSISDDGLLVLGGKIGRFDQPWRPFSWLEPSLGRFINDQALIQLRRKPPKLLGFDLHDTHGQLLLREDFHDSGDIIWGGRFCRSSGGQRLAFAFDKGKGGIEILDIAPHYSLSRIVVFDIPSRQWVYKLDGKQQRITKISGLALSSDGKQLAIIDQNGVLKAYRLP
jgi:hypothetical protein